MPRHDVRMYTLFAHLSRPRWSSKKAPVRLDISLLTANTKTTIYFTNQVRPPGVSPSFAPNPNPLPPPPPPPRSILPRPGATAAPPLWMRFVFKSFTLEGTSPLFVTFSPTGRCGPPPPPPADAHLPRHVPPRTGAARRQRRRPPHAPAHARESAPLLASGRWILSLPPAAAAVFTDHSVSASTGWESSVRAGSPSG